MSDLISKNKAIQRFIQETVDSNSNLIHINTAKRLLQDVDTAYSVNKVIEELELHSFELGTDTLPVHYVRLNDAIEIVKQSGDADDNCKWSQISTARYETSCGYKLVEFFDTNACYCKQCGKKIKIVGD